MNNRSRGRPSEGFDDDGGRGRGGGGRGFFDNLLRRMGGLRQGGEGRSDEDDSLNPMDIIDQIMGQMRNQAGPGEWADDDAGNPFIVCTVYRSYYMNTLSH